MRGKTRRCALLGSVVQVPALLVLIGGTFDMLNRFSVLLPVLLPYAAIADRLTHPPNALMWAIVIVTALQYPLYGAVIGHSWAKGRLPSTLAVVALIHAVASSVAIYMKFASA